MEAPVEVAIHLCLLACAHPQEKLAKRAPGEVAIHLCQMASAYPEETRTTSMLREAPGEVAIHLCLLASAHPQEELRALYMKKVSFAEGSEKVVASIRMVPTALPKH